MGDGGLVCWLGGGSGGRGGKKSGLQPEYATLAQNIKRNFGVAFEGRGNHTENIVSKRIWPNFGFGLQ